MEKRLSDLEHRFEIHQVKSEERDSHMLDILKRVDQGIVYRSEFLPVKSLVYGFVAIILIAVVGGLVGVVVKGG